MNKEIKIFIILAALFLVFYFLPQEPVFLAGAILSGFKLLNEYVREHVLFCLLPALFIAGAISVFVKKDFILKYLGGQAKKAASYSLASVSGAVLTVCSCTILPLFAGIRKRGAGLGPAVTFLFSGPAISIAAIFLTISVLGVKIGLARIISAVFLSIFTGLTMQAIFREKAEGGGLFIDENKQPSHSAPVTAIFMLSMVAVLVVNGLAINLMLKYILMFALSLAAVLIAVKKFPKETNKEWMKETWSFTKMLLPILFIGVFIAGFVMPFLPQALIERLLGANTLTGNLAAAVFGAFMYFSTLTEIPIVQALMAKGMSQGPALALLLAGPSLSLPNMLVIRSVLGNKKTVVYILIVVVYSTVAGLIFGGFFAPKVAAVNEQKIIVACPTYYEMAKKLDSEKYKIIPGASTADSIRLIKDRQADMALVGRILKPDEPAMDNVIISDGFSFLSDREKIIYANDLENQNIYTDLEIGALKLFFPVKNIQKVDDIYGYLDKGIAITSWENTDYAKAEAVHLLADDGQRVKLSRRPTVYCPRACGKEAKEIISILK